MRRWVNIIIGAVSIGIALVAGLNAQDLFMSRMDFEGYPVPNSDIAAYTVLTEGMFTERGFIGGLDGAADEYITDYDALIGKMTTGDLHEGLLIPTRNVVSVEAYRLAEPELEVVSVPLNIRNVITSNIQVQSIVNVYVIELTNSASMDIIKEDIIVGPVATDSYAWIASSGNCNWVAPTSVPEDHVRLLLSAKVVGLFDETGVAINRMEQGDDWMQMLFNPRGSTDRIPVSVALGVSSQEAPLLVEAIANVSETHELWITSATVR